MIKKKFFLFLTIICTVLCLVSCVEGGQGSVRVYFKQKKFEVKLNEELVLEPVVKVSADLDEADIELVYESLDESIVLYEDGVVYPVAMGKTKVKVYYDEDPDIYSTAEITVIKAALPEFKLEESMTVLKGDEKQIGYKLENNLSEALATFTVDEESAGIVSVTKEGKVTALAVGEATINVLVSDYEESYETSIKVVVVESDFAISYDLDGGVLPEGAITGYCALNLPIPLPTPTKVGYEFKGWELNGKVVEALPVGTYGDVSVKAVWEAVTYTIAYSEAVEGNVTTYTVEDLPLSLQPATKAGYEYKGWKLLDKVVTEIPAGTTGNLELTAEFEAIEYAISYSGVDEATLADLPAHYTVEELPLSLVALTKKGYEFKGYKLGEEVVSSIKEGSLGDVELVPVFETVTYELTYDANGGKLAGYASLEDIAADFVSDYNKFAGTSLTHVAEYWKESQKSSFWKNAELNAKWKWMIEVLITYSQAQGKDVQYLEALIKETPTVYGYATQNVMMYLLGINSDIWNSTYKDNYGTLSSKWTAVDCTSEEVQNSWKSVVGIVTSFTVEKELELVNATREGYEFLGWFVGDKQVTKVELGTAENVTVVAKWKEVTTEHTISYDVDGGVLPEGAVTKFEEGKGLETLPTPTKQGYKFLGWYEGEELVEAISAERKTDISLKAKWEEEQNSTGELTIDDFTAEFIADWNKYAVSQQAVVSNFQNTTASGIKEVFAKADMLAKYKWLFEFALVSLAEVNQGHLTELRYTNTVEVLEGLVKGDTEIINGGGNAEGRTLIRHWLHGLMNKELPTANPYYTDYSVDFSKAENQAAFLEKYAAAIAPVIEVTYDDVVKTLLADFGLDMSVSKWASNIDDLFRANLEKWGPLLDYFIAVRPADEFSAKITDIKNGVDLTGSVDPYIITGELVAFINKSVVEYPSAGITSGDYSVEETRERLWEFVSKDVAVITFGDLSFELNGGEVEEELPTSYKIGVKLVLPTPTKKDYIFLGWTLEAESTEYLTSLPASFAEKSAKLYAQWKFDAIYVGEGLDYATISEALAAAKEGDIIIVAAGTFAEEIVIEKNGIVILGANNGIAYNGVRSAETIINSITVKADYVVIDGVQIANFQAVKITGANYTTIKNSIMHGSPSGEREYVITFTDDTKGFTLLNSSIKETNATTHTRAIQAEGVKSIDITIIGNYIGQTLKTTETCYIDCIKLSNIVGSITIENNTFEWPGDNFTLFLGNESCADDTVVNINNNVFTSERNSSGVSVNGLPATATVNIIGNSFSKVTGNVIRVRGKNENDTTTEVTTNILNNAFKDTSTKITLNISAAKVTVDNNYFYTTVTWAAVSATVTNNAESAENALNGVITHKVIFNAGLGHLYGAPSSFVEGSKLGIASVIPTYVGMRFVGWYASSDFSGEVVTELGSQTADVTLYAKYEALAVYEVEYKLGHEGVTVENLVTSGYEGTVIKLPIPSIFGYTFLGWSLVENGEDYVTSITLNGDVTVYANWTNEEILTVTYVLNGGNFTYKDLDSVKADFDVDYKALTGQGSYSIWNNSSKLGKVFTDSNHKWDWLLEYWAGVNPNSYGGNSNANVFLQMRDQGTCPDYYFYGVEITSWTSSTQKSVYSGGLKSANYADVTIQDAWWSYFSKHEKNTQEFIKKLVLPTGMYNSETLEFVAWYSNPEFTGEPITEVTENTTVYAKWQERTPVTSIVVDNQISELTKFATYQLQWTINPAEAFIKSVQLTSSNPGVATIDDSGLITALSNGTTTITIKSKSSSGVSVSFDITVVTPDYFEAEYETNSFVGIDEEVKLIAEYVAGSSKQAVAWKSLNEDIAKVNAEGLVTGKKAGIAVIRAYLASDDTKYVDFYVTVVEAELSDAIKLVLANHESNIFTKYDLPIGYPDANQGYYKDIFGSVSNIFYNHELEIDESFLNKGNATGAYYENAVKNEGLEFITVHYTGTFGTTADTDNIATNFTNTGTSVSIHYVTGNHGKDSSGNETAEVFHTLSHDHGAYHAGDSRARTYANYPGDFQWYNTGVQYDGCDLLDVVFTASQDFYYEINGKKTLIELPKTWDYDGRNSNHIYNYETGLISSQSNFLSKFSWGATFQNRTPESFFNSLDFPIKVIDGYYYMGPTWWCFDQVVEGRICGSGGNRNSIGIESCVNEGSDVWYTWQLTAQLVAKLMYDNNLGIERVKGHHFFSGKDCPQPLLENDLEIWHKFIEMVQAEYELIDTYKDYEFTLSTESKLLSANGRVVGTLNDATCVQYTVTVKVGDKTETITLGSMVQSLYNKN